MKVFWLFTGDLPYPIRFFNLLGQSVELTVAFRHGRKRDQDRPYGERIKSFRSVSLKPCFMGGLQQIQTLLRNEQYDRIIMDGNRCLLRRNTISYLQRHHMPYFDVISKGRKCGLTRLHAEGYLVPDVAKRKELLKSGIPSDKIHLYHESVLLASEILPNPLGEKEKSLLRQGLGFADKKIYISINAASDKKRNLMLIDQWEEMPKNAVLLLFENGAVGQQYQEKIKQNHSSNVMLLSGEKRDDVLKYLRVADAALWTGEEEEFAFQIVAALSQGVPVFGNAKNPAVKEFIQEGVNGYRIETSQSLLPLLSLPLPAAMSQAAIESVKSYTLETMVQECLSALLP